MVRNTIARPSARTENYRGRMLFLAAACIAMAMQLFGQAARPSPQNKVSQAQQFEVASIKKSKPGDGSFRRQPLPNGFRATNLPLRSLVYAAYDIVTDSQISGLPRWADAEAYDVDARVDAKTAEAWKALTPRQRWEQQKQMLRLLLADRCQLEMHTEIKVLPVYELVIARGGLKMKESPPNEKSGMAIGSKITAHAMTVKDLADVITGDVGRLIVDKTGLAGKMFDFQLLWTPDDQQGSDDAGPSIFTAVKEQLGLKLVSSKGPVEVLVIDHMEKPSAN